MQLLKLYNLILHLGIRNAIAIVVENKASSNFRARFELFAILAVSSSP